jgi:hypothetical protein
MGSDTLTDLCAVLRSERDVPAGEAGACLTTLAQRHRVDRLLTHRSREADRVDALLDELSTRELCRVLDRLEAEGLVPLVFKGAALAHTHYPQTWTRPRLDADILIDPESRARAFEVLHACGYREPPVISGNLVSYQAMFVRPDEIGVEHVVDLHWQVANPQLVAHLLSHAELVARAQFVPVAGGGRLRVAGPVDALLIACLHRAAHHADADDLIWTYDIHLIASRFDAEQWGAFVAEANRGRIAAVCARGLNLAMECFQTRVPDEVMRQLSTTQEPSAIFLRRDARPVDRLAADLATLGPRQRVRLLCEHLFPPASYMRGKYGVQSSALLPAFYAYRILAGATKWLRRPAC